MKLRTCQGCGRKESQSNVGGIVLSNMLLGYCSECINAAMKETSNAATSGCAATTNKPSESH